MKAALFDKHGSPEVIKIKEIEKPKPRENEVLVKVMAITATAADGLMRRGEPAWGRLILGLKKPKKKYQIPGIELAGTIDEKGKKCVNLSWATKFMLSGDLEQAVVPNISASKKLIRLS